MPTAIAQALIIYALGFVISAGVAGMIKGLFLLVRCLSRGSRE
jgi:hypothetical protein